MVASLTLRETVDLHSNFELEKEKLSKDGTKELHRFATKHTNIKILLTVSFS